MLRNKTMRMRLRQLECVLSIWEIFQLRRSIGSFAVQEFLFRQFISSTHSDLRFQFFHVSAVAYCSMELRSKRWKKQVFPRLYHPANSVPLNPPFHGHISLRLRNGESFSCYMNQMFHFIREKPSLSQQCLCHLIQ